MKKFFALISGPSTEVEKSSLSEYAGNLISYSFLGLVNDNYYIFVIRGWGRGGWGGGGRRNCYSESAIPAIEVLCRARCYLAHSVNM